MHDNNCNNLNSDIAQQNIRYDSPRLGVSLASRVEARGAMVRKAVDVVSKGMIYEKIHDVFVDMFVCPETVHSTILKDNTLQKYAAWNLIALWITAAITLNNRNYSLNEAENWFHGKDKNKTHMLTSLVPPTKLSEADNILNNLVIDSEFKQLLPYILEINGPGSRASVIKNPLTLSSRTIKRKVGVFYTPADVADYMNEHVYRLYDGDISTAKVLDPACGTGVFLLSMVRLVKKITGSGFSTFNYITSCIHGLDISSHALDIAAFLLLMECFTDGAHNLITPKYAWKSIRSNLIELNALLVVPSLQNRNRPLDLGNCKDLTTLKTACLKANNGFDVLIGNPPYTSLGSNIENAQFKNSYASLKTAKVNSNTKVYPLFVEMMWQLTKPGCNTSALVLPLSISYHTGAQFQACRKSMSDSGGHWEFAFFDREPHALFGEEVKTRNAIVFRTENANTPKRGQSAELKATSLYRWSSRNRSYMFSNISFASLNNISITDGIPKLGNKLQVECFVALNNLKSSFSAVPRNIFKSTPAMVLNNNNPLMVVVGGTAYNFLNVYHPIKLQTNSIREELSKSPIHCLQFDSINEAHVAFSVLSSRLVYWLWYVLGDGFHVTARLFKAIPFNKDLITKDDYSELSNIGKTLWEKLQNRYFVSSNKGRFNVGFRPLEYHIERDAIDNILVKSYGLNQDIIMELKYFTNTNATNK